MHTPELTPPTDRPGTVEPPAADVPAIPAPESESVVRRAWRVFRREPMLLVTLGYLFVSMVGIWDSYWFFRGFGLPILEFMQSGDYFVAGLRRPAYMLVLGWALLVSGLSLWPSRWAERHPERAERIRRRRWGRLMLPRRSDWWAYGGLHPETAMLLVGLLMSAWLLFVKSDERARGIREGGGHVVRVTAAGSAAPLPGDIRLLGTSSAFVFLWWPAEQRVEAMPIEAVERIATLSRQEVPAVAPPAQPAKPVRPAAPKQSDRKPE